ncbi:hypothetical protein ACPCAA_17575 [Streptomyces griseoincarnatus]
MGRHAPSSRATTKTHPIGRLLAVPAPGQKGRRSAMAGYGLLVATVFTGLATSTLQESPEKAEKTLPPTAQEKDVFTAREAPGYAPTYLDGGGGIAGVPLTEEQRQALIREAKRRGLTTEHAYALAYGDNAVVHVDKKGKVHVDTSKVVVPNGPVYAQVAPTDVEAASTAVATIQAAAQRAPEAKVTQEPEAPSAEAPEDVQDPLPSAPDAGRMGVSSVESYYPTSGESVYEDESTLKEILPAPLEKVVDGVTSYSTWLEGPSTGTPETVGIVKANRLTMMVAAPLAGDLTLTTTVEAPIEGEGKVEPLVTAVITDNETGEVVAEESKTCPSVHAVSAVAIGETVDAVIEARAA